MSNLFEWSDKYSVGVVSLDEHHQQLFRLVNTLHAALTERKGREVIAEIVEKLLAYTQYHFAEEEKLMARARSNGIVAHKKMHADFVEQICVYKKEIDNGMVAFVTTEVMNTIRDWLLTHIARADKQYAASMKVAGIS